MPATSENFNEAAYLAANPDVKASVASGQFASGKIHFEAFGRNEKRSQLSSTSLMGVRARKLSRLAHLMDLELEHIVDECGRINFLTEDIRAETRIIDTNNISSNAYDGVMHSLIQKRGDGLILDCLRLAFRPAAGE